MLFFVGVTFNQKMHVEIHQTVYTKMKIRDLIKIRICFVKKESDFFVKIKYRTRYVRSHTSLAVQDWRQLKKKLQYHHVSCRFVSVSINQEYR